MSVVVLGAPGPVILYDSNGVEISVQNGVATPVGTHGIIVAGSDGTNTRFMRTAADGTVRTDPTGTTTQPVSAAALPLPTGAATAALQTQPGVDIGDVTVNNGAGAAAVNIQDGGNSITVDATALPLPTGAATAANQTTIGSHTTKLNDGTNTVDVAASGAARKRLRVEATIVNDEVGTPGDVNPRGMQLAAAVTRLVGGNIYGTLDTNVWSTALVGSGAVTPGAAVGVLSTGVTANSSAVLATIYTGAFINGTTNEYYAGLMLGNTGVANNTRTWGVADAATLAPTNGLFFELSGVTFRLRFRNAGVDTTVNNGAFNGNIGPTYTVDANFHLWRLVYTVGFVRAYIDGVLLHTFTPTNAAVAATVDLHVYAATVNASGLATNQTLTVRGQSINRHGGTDTVRLAEGMHDELIAFVVRSVITGKSATSGDYVNAAVDDNGRLVVAPVSSGSVLSGFTDGFVALTVATENVIRATTYNEQTTNAQRSIASSAAADDGAPAGTGARTVRITYYSNVAGTVTGPFTVDLVLNGTTAVNTGVTNICYVESIEVLTVGSGGTNAGTLTMYVGTGGGGGTLGTVAIGAGKAYWAHHYVASGRTCKITGLVTSNTATQGSQTFLRARVLNVADAINNQVSDVLRPGSTASGATTVVRTYGTPISVVGPAVIAAYVDPDQAVTATYYASFDFYEE